MGKNQDLIQILFIVILGMFIPFFGSITLSFGFTDPLKIALTFGYFLLIFAVELGIVYTYFQISGWMARRTIEKLKPK